MNYYLLNSVSIGGFQRRALLSLQPGRSEEIKVLYIEFPRVGSEPTTYRAYSHKVAAPRLALNR